MYPTHLYVRPRNGSTAAAVQRERLNEYNNIVREYGIYMTWHFSLTPLLPSPPPPPPSWLRAFFDLAFFPFLPSSCSDTLRFFSMLSSSWEWQIHKVSQSVNQSASHYSPVPPPNLDQSINVRPSGWCCIASASLLGLGEGKRPTGALINYAWQGTSVGWYSPGTVPWHCDSFWPMSP